MKIYFAGSIRGGREDKEKYLVLIDHLRKYGNVLTEHVGLSTLDEFGERKPSEEIFQRDVDWMSQADVVIAEVSTPSLGVGYELRLAEELNKKVICLFEEKDGKRLSAMIDGNKKFVVKIYKNIEEAISIIDEFFSSLAPV